MYGYANTLLYECYMRHGQHLTAMDHSTNHWMTSNYVPGMLRCYPGFQTQELELYTSSVVEWPKYDDTYIDMLSDYFISVE